MQTALVSMDEYLRSSYDPDREYLDGILLERNVGEQEHSRLQVMLAVWLQRLEKVIGWFVLSEQRVQVTPTRFRVPDLCLLRAPSPTPIVTTPPLICIELLSRDDRVSEMQERINDYLEMGVQCVLVIDPRTLETYSHRIDRVEFFRDGLIVLPEFGVVMNLREVLAQ